MLIKKIEIVHVEPCVADAEKIRLVARIPEDIREWLPYLNAKMANATYIKESDILTFTKGARLITLYPRKVTIAKAEDLEDAEKTLAWLAERINFVYENREAIEPLYEKKMRINPLDIYGWLPKTNCRACGETGCLPFALLLLQEKHALTDCRPLFEDDRFREQRLRLEEVVEALGLSVP